ncbi:MAG: TerB family tellurite resistance protein [Sphaerochaetaceae bacterium]
MGWLGKIIGGTLGLALGGPLGMVAGIVFGTLFDKADTLKTQTSGKSRSSLDSLEQSQMLFFVGTFSLLAKMAMADGRLLRQEKEKVEQFITQQLRLDEKSKEVAMRIFLTALSDSNSFEQYAKQVYEHFSNDRELLELILDVLVAVAASDGSIVQSEEVLIQAAARIFTISEAQLNTIKRKYGFSTIPSTKAYATLGITTGATAEEIKKAYRKKSQEFHPDTIASKGLPEEFTLFATEKFQEIQQAYETLKKEHTIR